MRWLGLRLALGLGLGLGLGLELAFPNPNPNPNLGSALFSLTTIVPPARSAARLRQSRPSTSVSVRWPSIHWIHTTSNAPACGAKSRRLAAVYSQRAVPSLSRALGWG